MTHKEVIEMIQSGRFANEYGFDLQTLVNAVGALVEMLRNGYTIALPPRVMTLDEVKASAGCDVWLELSGNIAEDVMTATTITGCGTNGISTRYESLDYNMYRVRPYGWRIWTSRPSHEQAQAEPWRWTENDG